MLNAQISFLVTDESRVNDLYLSYCYHSITPVRLLTNESAATVFGLLCKFLSQLRESIIPHYALQELLQHLATELSYKTVLWFQDFFQSLPEPNFCTLRELLKLFSELFSKSNCTLEMRSVEFLLRCFFGDVDKKCKRLLSEILCHWIQCGTVWFTVKYFYSPFLKCLLFF